MQRLLRNLFIVLVAFSLGVFIVWKQNASDRGEVWQLTQKYQSALVNNQGERVYSILDDDFKLFFHYRSGDKASVLEGIKWNESHPAVIESCEVIPILITADSENPRVTFRLVVRYPVRFPEEGKAITHDASYTAGYQKRDGNWRLISKRQSNNFSYSEGFPNDRKISSGEKYIFSVFKNIVSFLF